VPTRKAQHDHEAQVFERQAFICKAFGNSTRLHILHLLGRHDWGTRRLQKELGVSKASLSQHVAKLQLAGLLVKERRGKRLCLSLALPEVKWACQLIRNVLRAQIRNARVFL
jgi:ArsR family transcriptional regulator